MYTRLAGESFTRNPRRQLLTFAALLLGMAVATSTLSVALEVGDQLAREFRSFGANLLVEPQSDTLPLEIGGVDYRPVDEGAYISEADLGKLKTIFWRHNILGFTAFLDVPVEVELDGKAVQATLVGTWHSHLVTVPDGTTFRTGTAATQPWWKVRGRWFEDSAMECLVGASLASGYGIGEGSVIEVSSGGRRESLQVTGILSTGGAEENSIVAPLEVAQTLAGEPGRVRQVFVSALTKPEDALTERNPATLTPTEYDKWFCSPYASSIGHQVEEALPGTQVRTIRKVAETEGRVLRRVGSLLWLVTIAALVCAALAVAATSATTVIERRTEVGLMKALGATNHLVGMIFLGQQVVIALGGGLAGYGLGLVLARFLGQSVFGVAAGPRLVLLPVVLGVAVLVAVVGSAIPLRRAMRFDPAPILRGE
jgi:putative ABC transport system permease protein